MTGLKLGQYVHGNSLLHELDPRTKILCCVMVIAAVLINDSWFTLLFFLTIALFSLRIAGMKISYLLTSLRSIRSLLLLTFILQAVLVAGKPVWEIWFLQVSTEGLSLGLRNVLRLLVLYYGSLALLITTSPLKLSAGIEFLLQPLQRLKLPANNFSTILSISFRFIPTLVEEAWRIRNAQRARGAPFDSPRLLPRLKSYLAIIIPLFESSLTRAAELGEAMDSRCYSGHPNQLRMSRLRISPRDIIVFCLMGSITIIVFLHSASV